MSGVRSYRDLKVWQKALELAAMSYEVAKVLPKAETYGLATQIRRAAVSIPAKSPKGTAVTTWAIICATSRWRTAR